MCIKLNTKFFDSNRRIYSIKSWEQNGRFYTSVLKIKSWKDKLPQYIAKNGFSKRSIDMKFNKKYIERFILETCRAEWNHLMCCMYFVISLYINPLPYTIIFSVIPVLVNLPFLFIQRFNRIRLNKFFKKAYESKEYTSGIELKENMFVKHYCKK